MGEMMYGMGGMGMMLLMILIIVFQVVCFWRILPRAGIPAPVAILAILPPVTIILLAVLAFKTWPGDEEAR